MRTLQNIVLLFGLGAAVLCGYVMGSSVRKTIKTINTEQKEYRKTGYTLIQYGKAINQDGDTIQAKPLNLRIRYKQ